jgi:hypothetical protein
VRDFPVRQRGGGGDRPRPRSGRVRAAPGGKWADEPRGGEREAKGSVRQPDLLLDPTPYSHDHGDWAVCQLDPSFTILELLLD